MFKLDNESDCIESCHMFKSLRKIKSSEKLFFQNKMVSHGTSLNNPQIVSAEKAHDADPHCVDWNTLDDNLTWTDPLITLFACLTVGTSSGSVGSPIHIFEGHCAAGLCWSPDRASMFGSSAEDGIFMWDHKKMQVSQGKSQ